MNQANESPIVPLASALGVASPPHSSGSVDFLSWRMLSMSTSTQNEQFSVSEKVELLVNVLASVVPDLPSYLLHLIIVDLQRQPLWLDIALPKGRSLHACQIAFEEMRRNMPAQSGPVRPNIHTTPYVNIAPAIAPVRSVSESDPMLNTRRPLQPRPPVRTTESPAPPVTNGESPVYMRGPISDPAPEPSRKRGRPTKAAVAERDRVFAEKGQVYQPKRRPPKRMRPSFGHDAVPLKDEESTTPLLQTPQARITSPVGETSSGKRRPRRTPKDISPILIPDVEASAGAGTDTSRSGSERREDSRRSPEREADTEVSVVESPSDRLLAGNRDRGSIGSSFSRRTQQESESHDQGHVEPDAPT